MTGSNHLRVPILRSPPGDVTVAAGDGGPDEDKGDPMGDRDRPLEDPKDKGPLVSNNLTQNKIVITIIGEGL